MKKPKYYDWNKTLAYDADVTMVVGARGVGKTYGIRLQFVRDYIKKEWRFVELVRFKTELSGLQSSYFDRIESNEEFKDYIFKTDNNKAWIAKNPVDEDERIEWHLMGYFLAMSQAQQIKKQTFNKVRRILLDEAILDKSDRFHHYLPREFSVLANIVDTVSRERPDVKGIAPRIYLLGNALDVMNPYFIHYNIGVPNPGYSWHSNKTMLLDYVQDETYQKSKAKDTVAGRMLAGTVEGKIASDNEFTQINADFVLKKTKTAKFSFGIHYMGYDYAIWADWSQGLYFVTSKIPNNTDKPIFTLTLDENRLNYVAARRAETMLRGFSEMHYHGMIRYESIQLRERFKEILALFGVR